MHADNRQSCNIQSFWTLIIYKNNGKGRADLKDKQNTKSLMIKIAKEICGLTKTIRCGKEHLFILDAFHIDCDSGDARNDLVAAPKPDNCRGKT